MRLLVTRPKEAADRTKAALEEDGHQCVVSPLLVRQELDWTLPSEKLNAIALTSSNTLISQSIVDELLSLGAPVFAVGDRTAEQARSAGFKNVFSASGDVSDLARLIGRTIGKDGVVLYPCAEQVSGDLAGRLKRAAIAAIAVPVYAMRAAEDFTQKAKLELQDGSIDGVLLYSARSARIFSRLLNELSVTCPPLFALSEAICRSLPQELTRHCFAAPEPNEAALRLLLQETALCGKSSFTGR